MSQDIRSFFSAIRKKKENSQKQDATVPVVKKKRIIESDSDEELSPKRTKALHGSKRVTNKKNEEPPKKSKYFETSAKDMFGGEPIKRILPKKIIKKTPDPEVVENQSDSDFEAALLQMDDVDLDKWEQQTNSSSPTSSKTHIADISAKRGSSSLELDTEKLEEEFETGKSSSVHNISPEQSPRSSPLKKEKFTSANVEKSHSIHSISPKETLSYSPSKNQKVASIEKSISVHNMSPEQSPQKSSVNKQNEIFEINSVDKISSKRTNKNLNSKNSPKIITNNNDIIKEKKIKVSQNCNKEEKSNTNDNLSQITKSVQNDESLLVASPKRKNVIPVETKEEKKKGLICSKNGSDTDPNKLLSQEILESSLWVDKYRPKTLKQIVGQQGDKSNVKKLISWLQNWHKNQSNRKKFSRPSPWAKNDDGAFFKAALLSGPPGVGKTTTAHLVCKELGFDVVEFNASDTRSKKMLHQEISELLSTKSLTPFFTGNGIQSGEISKNHALIMDEVDGMAGNEDRGGVQELIQLVKTSRIPVICMCNDRNHPKIRSLANYCFDLRFQRPRAEQIRGAMMSVCYKENLKIAPNTMTDIISCANQDIRLVLNHLSILAAQKSDFSANKKHIKLGPWDVVRLVFSEKEHKTMSIHDKCDLFFHDYSIGPLFVQENYLNVAPHSENIKNKRKKMELFAKVAHSISLGDVTDKVIRTQNAWSLLPTQAIFSSFIPGQILEGHMAGQINFPSWLGKNSKRGKLDRLLQEVQIHTRLRVSGSKESINLDYLLPLRDHVVRPLVQHGSEGISAALNSLQEYNLVREDLDSLNELSLWPNSKDPMAKVDSKVKAGFTRAYNKSGILPPYAISSVVKKGKGDFGGEDNVENEEENIDEEEEEDESVEVDAMVTVKKKPNKRLISESSSKGKGSSSKRSKTSNK